MTVVLSLNFKTSSSGSHPLSTPLLQREYREPFQEQQSGKGCILDEQLQQF
jgi:hypothetical protein